MMMRVAVAFGLFGVLLGSADAALIDRGNGLIYDDGTNLTWTQDAGFGGRMGWGDAIAWADALVYRGYDDWRLPTALEMDGDAPCQLLFNCNGSEMGHLFYDELGNSANVTNPSSGPFVNLERFFYWTATELGSNLEEAWFFYFLRGSQSTDPKGNLFNVWAVRDGDVAQAGMMLKPVPLPAAIWLYLCGLVVLGFGSRRH